MMDCPRCHSPVSEDASYCGKCGLAIDANATVVGEGTGAGTGGSASQGWSVPVGTSAGVAAEAYAHLQTGSVIGGRYEIVQLLGEGGMGAVYKAHDRELDRTVALKIIRPDLARSPAILNRFKQELILARQVTHRNVIRIFDLGTAEGMKFITMDFIDGRDLKTLLRERGKLPPEEVRAILVQVCRALEAAHAEGVVHRDLKPQNIMLDAQGKVSVMDFGIARSVDTQGITQTGELLGTPEYMSPEQARGERADHRSDLFSLGIIAYELLTGATPFKGENALATLLKRAHERARPPAEIDRAIPDDLNALVMKCLETDPAQRYQSATEVLADLQPGGETAATRVLPRMALPRFSRRALFALAGVLVMAVAIGGYLLTRDRETGGTGKTITLLVADFQNNTSEPVFEGTLEPVFTLALEGARFINAYNRADARRTAAQLRPGATKLDEALARLVAVRQGIDVVISGAISKSGGEYTVSVQAVDAVTGKPVVSRQTTADKEKLLSEVSKLAPPLRRALGDATPESTQLAAAETYTAANIEASHEYAVAQEHQLAGRWDEASRAYQRAIEFDPNLGRAYAGLAVVHANTGRRAEAEKYYQTALTHIDRMTDREKFRTRGGYYVLTLNYEKAAEELSALVRQYPSDTAGLGNLAIVYFYQRNMAKALEQGRKAVEIYPKNVAQRNNVALFAMYASDFDAAVREARAVMEMNPAFAKAYVALALSQLAQGKPELAADAYRKLEGTGGRGASLAAMGLADLAMYEGRATEAVPLLQAGMARDLETKSNSPAALKAMALAQAQLLAGQKPAVAAALGRALELARHESVQYAAAIAYLGAGQEPRARALAADMAARLEAEPQMYAKLVEGEILLARRDGREAVRVFKEALKLADAWLGHFGLGRAYLEAGAFTEASSEFDACIRRRGEATAVFLDDVPSFRYFPPVYYYLGRAQEGLKSPGAAESYKTFLAIKKGGEDPLVADARRRIGQ